MRAPAALAAAVLAMAPATGALTADGWFDHPFGEARAYHGDWLAVCPSAEGSACRVVRMNPTTDPGAAWEARLAAERAGAGWRVELATADLVVDGLDGLAFAIDGETVAVPREAWTQDGANGLVVADPALATALVERMKAGNRLTVSSGPGVERASFPLRGVTAAIRAIGRRAAREGTR